MGPDGLQGNNENARNAGNMQQGQGRFMGATGKRLCTPVKLPSRRILCLAWGEKLRCWGLAQGMPGGELSGLASLHQLVVLLSRIRHKLRKRPDPRHLFEQGRQGLVGPAFTASSLATTHETAPTDEAAGWLQCGRDTRMPVHSTWCSGWHLNA